MAKFGTLPMPIRFGSCWRNELQYRRASDSCVVQAWPEVGTYWRGSSQIGQRGGSFSEGANCVPQVTQMKAGMGGAYRRDLKTGPKRLVLKKLGAAPGSKRRARLRSRFGVSLARHGS